MVFGGEIKEGSIQRGTDLRILCKKNVDPHPRFACTGSIEARWEAGAGKETIRHTTLPELTPLAGGDLHLHLP